MVEKVEIADAKYFAQVAIAFKQQITIDYQDEKPSSPELEELKKKARSIRDEYAPIKKGLIEIPIHEQVKYELHSVALHVGIITDAEDTFGHILSEIRLADGRYLRGSQGVLLALLAWFFWKNKSGANEWFEALKQNLPIKYQVFLQPNPQVVCQTQKEFEALKYLIIANDEGSNESADEDGLDVSTTLIDESDTANLALTSSKFRWLPNGLSLLLHNLFVKNSRLFDEPEEAVVLQDIINEQILKWKHEIAGKTYIPLPAKQVPSTPPKFDKLPSGFHSPIQNLALEIKERMKGGDAQDANIVRYGRKAKRIRNLASRLRRSKEPLVILGEPGSGKSITLLQVAQTISEGEKKRSFPKVCIFVKLGTWQPLQNPDAKDVEELVRASCPEKAKPYFDDLLNKGRFIIIFDGMDEMSRQKYIRHTQALSDFAQKHIDKTKTLFSCRISDFARSFSHKRLVLQDFTPKLMEKFICKQFGKLEIPIQTGDKIETYSAKQFVKELRKRKTAIKVSNPYALYLVMNYVTKEQKWPEKRTELLEFYYRDRIHNQRRGSVEVFLEKLGVDGEFEEITQSLFDDLSIIARKITERDRGTDIDIATIQSRLDTDRLHQVIKFATIIGVVKYSQDSTAIRFEHQRAREYFTALNLSKETAGFDWSTRYDMQRWQETLVNVTQMNALSAPLIDLAFSIDDIAKKFDQPNDQSGDKEGNIFPADKQAKAAYRLELAIRVLVECETNTETIWLAGSMCEASKTMAEKGNPATQVRLIQMSSLAQKYRSNDTETERPIDEVSDTLSKIVMDLTKSDISWVRETALEYAAHQAGTAATAKLAEDVAFTFGAHRSLPALKNRLKIAWKEKRSALAIMSVFTAALQCLLYTVAAIIPFAVTTVICSYLIAPLMIDQVVQPLYAPLGVAQELTVLLPDKNFGDLFKSHGGIFGLSFVEAVTVMCQWMPVISLLFGTMVTSASIYTKEYIPSKGNFLVPKIPLIITVLICGVFFVAQVLTISSSSLSYGDLIQYHNAPELVELVPFAIALIASLFVTPLAYWLLFLSSCIIVGAASVIWTKDPFAILASLIGAFPKSDLDKIEPTWSQIHKGGATEAYKIVRGRTLRNYQNNQGVIYHSGNLASFILEKAFLGLSLGLLILFGYGVVWILKKLYDGVAFIGDKTINLPVTSNFFDGLFFLNFSAFGLIYLIYTLRVKSLRLKAALITFTCGIIPVVTYYIFNAIARVLPAFGTDSGSGEPSKVDIEVFFESLLGIAFYIYIAVIIVSGIVVGLLFITREIRHNFKGVIRFVFLSAIGIVGVIIALLILKDIGLWIFEKVSEAFAVRGWGIMELLLIATLAFIAIILFGLASRIFRQFVIHSRYLIGSLTPDSEFAERFAKLGNDEKLANFNQVHRQIDRGEQLDDWEAILLEMESDISSSEPIYEYFHKVLKTVQEAKRLQSA